MMSLSFTNGIKFVIKFKIKAIDSFTQLRFNNTGSSENIHIYGFHRPVFKMHTRTAKTSNIPLSKRAFHLKFWRNPQHWQKMSLYFACQSVKYTVSGIIIHTSLVNEFKMVVMKYFFMRYYWTKFEGSNPFRP